MRCEKCNGTGELGHYIPCPLAQRGCGTYCELCAGRSRIRLDRKCQFCVAGGNEVPCPYCSKQNHRREFDDSCTDWDAKGGKKRVNAATRWRRKLFGSPDRITAKPDNARDSGDRQRKGPNHKNKDDDKDKDDTINAFRCRQRVIHHAKRMNARPRDPGGNDEFQTYWNEAKAKNKHETEKPNSSIRCRRQIVDHARRIPEQPGNVGGYNDSCGDWHRHDDHGREATTAVRCRRKFITHADKINGAAGTWREKGDLLRSGYPCSETNKRLPNTGGWCRREVVDDTKTLRNPGSGRCS